MSTTILNIARLVGRGFIDAIQPFSGEAGAQRIFLRQLGYGPVEPPPALSALSASADHLATALGALSALEFDLDEGIAIDQQVESALEDVLAGVGLVVAAVTAASALVSNELPDFETRLFGFALVRALEREQPLIFAVLLAAGIVDATDVAIEEPVGVPLVVQARGFSGDRLLSWFRSPKQALGEVYGWGTPTIDVQKLFVNVQRLIGLRQRRPVIESPTDGEIAAYGMTLAPDQSDLPPRLSIPIGTFTGGDVSLAVIPLPPSAPAAAQELALTLEVSGKFEDTQQLTDTWSLAVRVGADVGTGLGVVLRPGQTPRVLAGLFGGGSASQIDTSADIRLIRSAPPSDADVDPNDASIISIGNGSGVSAQSIAFTFAASSSGTSGELSIGAAIKGGSIVIASEGSDGFLSKVLPDKDITFKFDAGVIWSSATGVRFDVAGGLETVIPLHLQLGPVSVDAVTLRIVIDNGLKIGVTTDVGVKLGPVSGVVNGMGAHVDLALKSGNLGVFDASAGFQSPTGVGIAVNGGPVSGGGFLTFEDSKYSGALALSVYAVAVKAFGIIETKFPDGHRGFSFIIIISAEFTPIQLGFGFTLNGVGGILGINRDLNEDALRDVVQRGSMGNVLFPKDPIKDAPSILHDIAQLFPAADGHFVFGPMAILAWGTPAIVEARLGIIIVFPGPRIALLGTVQVLLPPGTGQQAPEKRLVEIHLDIAGVLDFPKKHFALDAHLHDSNVVGFPISGDMAARIDWGANPNMVIAMGGFHPHFTPPAGFPKLRRLSIDLGIKGNPTATLSGYMAVTSNTAQIGAALDVTASAAGASLKGGLAFDAIFVFSPFSFDATLEGGVHVDFHGAGFGMHFHGEISGPAPWHLKGDVCVSILWWDACVGFNLTLGGEKRPELPAVDVWAGSAEVPGLQSAIAAPGNWTALMPPNGYQAVSLRETDASSASRVDPLGTAKFEQKVLPFKLAISKFAGRDRAKNDAVTVLLNKVVIDGDDLAAAGRVNPESDFFAPAQYQKLPDAQALSSPSFQPMQAGFSFTSKDLKAGVEKTKVISFQTFVVGNPGTGQVSDFPVNDNQLLAMTGRSAVATGGLRTGNIDRFVDFGKQPAFTFTTEAYALAFKSTLKRFTTAADDAAYALTADKLAAQPADVRGTLQIVPVHELAA